ncbi:MAG: 50S ribosomal protein L6 [Patescibacteria group bacterium]|jgi:large subunit ribosomal protein L6
MPRVGKKPISIPAGVEVNIQAQHVLVKGPKGTLEKDFHHRVIFVKKDSIITVDVSKPEEKRSRELWGLSRVLLANMIEGVTKGYEKKLEINGVGYRASVAGKKIVLILGYSHPIEFPIPEELEAKIEKNVITISGMDKQMVGQIAAEIRDLRKPEPYKGKGIRYIDEVVRRKAGKVVKAAGAG